MEDDFKIIVGFFSIIIIIIVSIVFYPTKEELAKREFITESVIWEYLKLNDYSDIQISAIIGNLYQESGLDPKKVEYGTQEGIGIVQWSFGRKQELIEFCEDREKDWTDLECQLAFLVKELKSSQFFQPYKDTFYTTNSIDEATEAFCSGFERPNKDLANMSYRKLMAKEAYERNVDS